MVEYCSDIFEVSFKVLVFCLLVFSIQDGIKKFMLDYDVSLISFKTFHETADDLYPSTSLCFFNPFLAEKLKNYGSGINITSYSQYLQGEIFDEDMKFIPYDNVTVAMEDYLLAISAKLHNGSFFWIYDKTEKSKYIFNMMQLRLTQFLSDPD